MGIRLTDDTIEAHYSRHVLPVVTDIEIQRVKARNQFILLSAIAIAFNIALVGVLYFGGRLFRTHDNPTLHIMLLSIVFCAWGAAWPLRHFEKSTRALLLEKIIPLFPGFKVDIDRQLDSSTMDRTGIFPNYDYNEGGNYITGIHEGVNIDSVDLWLRAKRRTSKGGSYTVTVFKGSVYIFSFPKTFTGDIRLTTDRGWLVNKMTGVFSSLPRVSLEDPAFEKLFEVYAKDQIEARYILTTGFMERLLRLSDSNNKGIEAAFFDNRLLVKLKKDKMRFTVPNPLRSIDWHDETMRFIAEFYDALAVVDELKLNQRIGL